MARLILHARSVLVLHSMRRLLHNCVECNGADIAGEAMTDWLFHHST